MRHVAGVARLYKGFRAEFAEDAERFGLTAKLLFKADKAVSYMFGFVDGLAARITPPSFHFFSAPLREPTFFASSAKQLIHPCRHDLTGWPQPRFVEPCRTFAAFKVQFQSLRPQITRVAHQSASRIDCA